MGSNTIEPFSRGWTELAKEAPEIGTLVPRSNPGPPTSAGEGDVNQWELSNGGTKQKNPVSPAAVMDAGDRGRIN